MSIRSLLVSACSVILLATAGCGYTTGSLLPSKYKTIHVAPILNKVDYVNQDQRKIYIPGLESRVRAVLIDRFLFDGNLHVNQEDTADLILKGELLSFEREELRLTTAEDVKEYRLRITVSLQMIDPAENNKVLWSEPSFAGESTYYTSGPLAKSESTAIDEALKDLAIRAVGRTIEDW
ncbi:MAG: LptE family protein [Candidatus Omnitrophica bacterium]|nr:LptE family protein [Candidatus Omnitrophota bacterium]